MSNILRVALAIILLGCNLSAHASDLAKEKRWANEIVDSIMDGDAVWLNDGSHKFLGIYTEAKNKSDRAAIVMHGIGAHPNWDQVVRPLRVGLTNYGWNTLSIQMPILKNSAKPAQYAPLFPKEVPARINAAIKYLQAKGMKHIVLVGHSMGSLMGTYYLSKHSKPIEAFVAVGLDGEAGKGVLNGVHLLKSIHIPMLDLYGSNDLKGVLDTRKQRAAAARAAGNTHYTQKMVKGANHFFDGKNDKLVKIVGNWLNQKH